MAEPQKKKKVKEWLWTRDEDGKINLLLLDDPILERIVDYLFPKKTVEFVSWTAADWGSMLDCQTHYPADYHTAGRHTYITTNRYESLPEFSNFAQPAPLDFAVNFLCAGPECFSIGARALYGRTFKFPPEVQACLAFLHDHGRREYRIGALDLSYTERTKPDIWRYVFNVLVHERWDIFHVDVTLGEAFWNEAPWQSGVQAVMEWAGWGWSKARKRPLNFIDHMVRLPLKSRMFPNSKGITFGLYISGSNRSKAREVFEGELDTEIYTESRRQKRTNIHKYQGYGYCMEKRLEHTCYWNILKCTCTKDATLSGMLDWMAVRP